MRIPNMKMLSAALSGIALWVSVPAGAQAPSSPPGANMSGDRVTIGIGPAAVPSYDGSNDEVIVPMIGIQGQLSGIAFDLQGTTLYADLVPDRGGPGWKLQAGPQLALRLDRTGHVEDSAVKALGRLRTAFEVGGWAGIRRRGVVTSPYDALSVSLAYQADIGNAHRSYIVSPSVTYETPLSTRDYASLTLGADYVGRGFGDYYYDIDAAAHAASGLGAYDAADRPGWKDFNANLLLAHAVRGSLLHGLAIFATGGYSKILGVYARSPLVDVAGSRNQWSGAAGLAFTF